MMEFVARNCGTAFIRPILRLCHGLGRFSLFARESIDTCPLGIHIRTQIDVRDGFIRLLERPDYMNVTSAIKRIQREAPAVSQLAGVANGLAPIHKTVHCQTDHSTNRSTMIASYIPARQASRVDALQALRQE